MNGTRWRRRYDSSDNTVGAEFQMNTITTSEQSNVAESGMEAGGSASLLGVLARMAILDRVGKRNLYRCPCGRVIASAYPESSYCSPQHRERYKKREKRQKAR